MQDTWQTSRLSGSVTRASSPPQRQCELSSFSPPHHLEKLIPSQRYNPRLGSELSCTRGLYVLLLPREDRHTLLQSIQVRPSQVLRPTFFGKWVGEPMSLKQGNFSFRARTAHNWLRMGKYGFFFKHLLHVNYHGILQCTEQNLPKGKAENK